MVTSKSIKSRMYTFSSMMVVNTQKHHCRVRLYTREVLVISTNLDIQNNHYPLDFTNRKGVEARIKNTFTLRTQDPELRAQLFDKASEQKDTTKVTSVNTQFCKQSILGKPPSSYGSKLYVVTPFPKSIGLPKIDVSHAVSKLVTLNSVPTTKESKVVENDKVIAPGMFRIAPRKTFREDKFVPINEVIASIRTNPITISQTHVITKKDVNSNSNGLSSTRIESTAKTRRSQPRSNTKNDRVPSASKSSCIKNKEVEVEEHHMKLMFSKNKIHMSSECNNIKLAIQNDKSEVVCDMCKKCLITANHDVCMLNHVNDMNSRGSTERLASPKPSKPRSCLRWSTAGRIFDLKGKIIASSESESQSNCSKGHSNLFMVRRLGMLKAHDRKSEASHKFHLEVLRNHLKVAFRRNTYFVRNLEGVDLLKGNHTTNLYTINLHEMAYVSPICLMARATSTKSWLWHQRLSNLNFDTINDLAKNDLVTGLPKFKYHKEHLCPSCEIYNRGTKKIIETMNVTFDELLVMAFEQNSSKPRLQSMTSRQISSGLDLTYDPSTITTQKPTERELDLLFEAMYDDYIGGKPSAAIRITLAAQAPQVLQTPTIRDTAPTPKNSFSQATNNQNTS
ncbi:retrovirus-related pol polyprotein from transposon TNT 1-94 [Tanacetum coccineum]